jgi:site-specific recombinase XerD
VTACQRCGTALALGKRRGTKWCSPRCAQAAGSGRRKAGLPAPPRWQHPALTSDDPQLQAAASHARELGLLHGWSNATILHAIDGLSIALDGRAAGEPVPLTWLRASMPRRTSTLRVAEVLASLDLLRDDTVPALRLWIERSSAALPAGFASDVRAWLLTLLDGDERARPRHEETIRAYFSSVRPLIQRWSATRGHLRAVTAEDIAAAMAPLRGSRHMNTAGALKSLFGFAKRKKLIFSNPASRLRVTRPQTPLVPMTAEQIRAIEAAAVSPAQRLVVTLAAIHAASATTIRGLTLDDLDLPRRRITLAGTEQPLSDTAHQVLTAWLGHRRRQWPHTPNRHVLVNEQSAKTRAPVSRSYLHHRLVPGIGLDRIRQDRILHEALTVGADPLHLTLVFQLSPSTASRYGSLAQHILEDDPISVRGTRQ